MLVRIGTEPGPIVRQRRSGGLQHQLQQVPPSGLVVGHRVTDHGASEVLDGVLHVIDSIGPAFVNDTQLVGMTRGPFEFIDIGAVLGSIDAQPNPVGKGFVVTNN